MSFRAFIPVLAFAALVVLLSLGLREDPSRLPSPFIGKPAPRLDLPTLADSSKRITNADFAGKTVLVNVWATWCVSCRDEHRFLLELAKSKAIPIYGINWRDTSAEAKNWLQQLGNPYTEIGEDRDGRAGIDWGVYGAPESFLIGSNGKVLHKQIGPLDQQNWERDFVPLIESQEPGT
ncbi:MAG: DsbE family thiol:disulfide interchange protein [Woeseiaceae bacterium]